ncbi:MULTISPECIES: hypothetical protein [Isoptericola]|uniref:hypothetical protein n=1 Tax=Isoptericola TaxID=254250 RepID=UPI001FAEFE35|nr:MULTISPECIES: hypothetical protein [Isoptericola]
MTFEISRRHRFFRELDDVPDGVVVHVLPSGGPVPGDEKLTSFRRLDATRRRIDQSYRAAARYLADSA